MPLYALEFQKKVQNVDRMNKVDKGIANVALGLKFKFNKILSYLKIHRQVEIVILSNMALIDHIKKGALLEFIRNIPNHHSCPVLRAIKNPI
jgi:hypothetical protein